MGGIAALIQFISTLRDAQTNSPYRRLAAMITTGVTRYSLFLPLRATSDYYYLEPCKPPGRKYRVFLTNHIRGQSFQENRCASSHPPAYTPWGDPFPPPNSFRTRSSHSLTPCAHTFLIASGRRWRICRHSLPNAHDDRGASAETSFGKHEISVTSKFSTHTSFLLGLGNRDVRQRANRAPANLFRVRNREDCRRPPGAWVHRGVRHPKMRGAWRWTVAW